MIAITSEDHEWYTPQYLLQRVYKVFPVSLDPCSNDKKTVWAETHYTKEDNGLSLPWGGNIYMNPPYGREISKWVTKFLAEWNSGSVQNAILLMPVKTETRWWYELSEHLTCWCAIYGRIKFVSPVSGKQTTNFGTFASAMILFTYEDSIRRKFIDQMLPIGKIWFP